MSTENLIKTGQETISVINGIMDSINESSKNLGEFTKSMREARISLRGGVKVTDVEHLFGK